MNKVFVVFSREKSNPFAAHVVVGITDTIEAARRMTVLNNDSYVDCVIQEWDLETLNSLNDKVPWYVILWNGGDTLSVRRLNLSDDAKDKKENKIMREYCDESTEILVWANNKDEAIEEARRMLNERSN